MPAIRDGCSEQVVGGGPIQVFDARDVAIKVRSVATSKSFRDNPALVAMKVLAEAEMLLPLSEDDWLHALEEHPVGASSRSLRRVGA